MYGYEQGSTAERRQRRGGARRRDDNRDSWARSATAPVIITWGIVMIVRLLTDGPTAPWLLGFGASAILLAAWIYCVSSLRRP